MQSYSPLGVQPDIPLEPYCSYHHPCLRVRNKRELNAKLKGTTLGDADVDVDDTLKWLKRSKRKERELAKKRLEQLEDMDKVYQDYTESTLDSRPYYISVV